MIENIEAVLTIPKKTTVFNGKSKQHLAKSLFEKGPPSKPNKKTK